MSARHEHGVRAPDPGFSFEVEESPAFHERGRLRRIGDLSKVAALNVFRTVHVRLAYDELDSFFSQRRHEAVDSKSPARAELDREDAEHSADPEIPKQRVCGRDLGPRSVDSNDLTIRSTREALFSEDERSPYLTRFVDTRRHEHPLLREEEGWRGGNHARHHSSATGGARSLSRRFLHR
jgi:hypothetical protein